MNLTDILNGIKIKEEKGSQIKTEFRTYDSKVQGSKNNLVYSVKFENSVYAVGVIMAFKNKDVNYDFLSKSSVNPTPGVTNPGENCCYTAGKDGKTIMYSDDKNVLEENQMYIISSLNSVYSDNKMAENNEHEDESENIILLPAHLPEKQIKNRMSETG